MVGDLQGDLGKMDTNRQSDGYISSDEGFSTLVDKSGHTEGVSQGSIAPKLPSMENLAAVTPETKETEPVSFRYSLYSRPLIIRTSLIRILDYPNYQINDIHSINFVVCIK